MKNNFSVVLSVYKNDNYLFLKESIDSLICQTLSPNEIIIVIDGPVEKKILDYLNSLDLNIFNLVYLDENKGLANALNVGIKIAKNSLIARMDSDDICYPDRFKKQIEFMNKNDVDILGGQILEFGCAKDDIISERRVPLHHCEIIDFMKFRSPFSHPTIMFKKNVFETLGGYDTNIFPEDYDFFVRAYLKGFRFANLQDNILWFRMGEDRSKAIKRRWGVLYAKNEFKLYKKFYRLGFYNAVTFLKAVLFKIPIRLLPFSLYKFIYFKILR